MQGGLGRKAAAQSPETGQSQIPPRKSQVSVKITNKEFIGACVEELFPCSCKGKQHDAAPGPLGPSSSSQLIQLPGTQQCIFLSPLFSKSPRPTIKKNYHRGFHFHSTD